MRRIEDIVINSVLERFRLSVLSASSLGNLRRYPQINFQDLSYYSAPKQKSEKVCHPCNEHSLFMLSPKIYETL